MTHINQTVNITFTARTRRLPTNTTQITIPKFLCDSLNIQHKDIIHLNINKITKNTDYLKNLNSSSQISSNKENPGADTLPGFSTKKSEEPKKELTPEEELEELYSQWDLNQKK